MKSTELTSFWLKKLEARPVFTSVLLAIFIRTLALLLGFQDYWGDSHHNLIMSKLTLDNGWVYSDFKDRELSWSPAFRYWGSIILWITGSAKLITLNIANSFLGVIIVGLGVWFIREIRGKKIALLAGSLLALTPYLIVFSYMNMAEGFGALLLLAWLIGVDRNQIWLVFITALLASLTRYELVFFLGVASLYLLIVSKRKGFVSTTAGVVVGLSIWSWWSYINTGDLLNWFWMQFASSSASTEFYAEGVNVYVRFLLLPMLAILQVFPLFFALIWLKKIRIRKKEYSLNMLMGSLILGGLLFFAYAQTSVIVYPDPRYLVMILPVIILWFCTLLDQGFFRPFISKRLVLFITVISLFQLLIPYYRQYNLQPRIEMGTWMHQNLSDTNTIWSDNAVSIAQSGLEIRQFKSSNKLNVADVSDQKTIEKKLMESGIDYLTVFPAPFTTSYQWYPELMEASTFEKNGITFVPVFEYEPFQMQKGSVHDYLRMKFEAAAGTASIWKLYYN